MLRNLELLWPNVKLVSAICEKNPFLKFLPFIRLWQIFVISQISKSLEILFKSGNSTILKCWISSNWIGEISVAYFISVSYNTCSPTLFQSFTILHICYIQLLPSQLAVFDMLFMAFLRSHFQIAFFSSHCTINSTLNRCSFVSQAIQICFHLRWDSLPSFWYLILNDFSWIKMDQENFLSDSSFPLCWRCDVRG